MKWTQSLLALVRSMVPVRRLVILGSVAVLGLSGCGGDEVTLPPVTPLSASPDALATLYKAETGPLDVVARTDVHLALDDSELELSVFYPDAAGPFPILLFSHGNWSTKDKYNPVIEHWVSHGYVVLAPNHLDCCGMVNGIWNSVRFGQFGLIEERIRDFSRLLDHLPQVEQAVAGLAGKMDATRIAATGHSFGAFTTQQFGGAGTFNPETEEYVYFTDERIKAMVAISPPGPMFDVINENSWVNLQGPMMLTTGTWDSNAQFWPDWRAHKLSFDTAKPGQNYALITQGADHYLGNLICRPEREEPPQHDALKMLNSATTAFLDAYVKNSPEALAFVNSDSLQEVTNNFSQLQRR